MVSIVTGTLNRLHLLTKIIQNTVNSSDKLELVLVDGGSSDGTIEYWENGYEIENINEWKAAIKIQKNWKISKHSKKYFEFYCQILNVPENHDSSLGKLFPGGGYEWKKIDWNEIITGVY